MPSVTCSAKRLRSGRSREADRSCVRARDALNQKRAKLGSPPTFPRALQHTCAYFKWILHFNATFWKISQSRRRVKKKINKCLYTQTSCYKSYLRPHERRFGASSFYPLGSRGFQTRHRFIEKKISVKYWCARIIGTPVNSYEENISEVHSH